MTLRTFAAALLLVAAATACQPPPPVPAGRVGMKVEIHAPSDLLVVPASWQTFGWTDPEARVFYMPSTLGCDTEITSDQLVWSWIDAAEIGWRIEGGVLYFTVPNRPECIDPRLWTGGFNLNDGYLLAAEATYDGVGLDGRAFFNHSVLDQVPHQRVVK